MPAALCFPRRALIVYLAVCGVVLAFTLGMTGGHFSCSLDDPYIHLALAQQLLHGHYGINAGEASAPSSSILWPFLLAPLSRTAVAAWLPVAWNLVFGVLTCLVAGRIVERWWLSRAPEVSGAMQWVLAFLLLMAGNVYALTFMGMEHLLQIALMCGCAYALLAAYDGERMPTWTLVCAALAPLVRYEDLAFTLPVVLVCWWQGRRGAAVWTWLGGTLPLLGFSFYLHHLGLYWLPTSVLVKGNAVGAHESILHSLLHQFGQAVSSYLLNIGGISITLLAVLLTVLAVRERGQRAHGVTLAATALGVWLMIVLGPYGWLHRYEAALRLFVVLMAIGAGLRMRRVAAVWVCAGLLFVGFANVKMLVSTPFECSNIYRQQYQMHRFLQGYYQGNVAVNDLGWVSFNHGDHRYVLDLFGLGSQEAANQGPVKSVAWLDEVTRRHHVGLVMIYPSWFAERPASWIDVAELHEQISVHGALGGSDVAFYATPDADVAELRAELHAFAKTLPAKTWMTFPDGGDRPAGETAPASR